MGDDQELRAPADESTVNVNEPSELAWWAQKLAATYDQLPVIKVVAYGACNPRKIAFPIPRDNTLQQRNEWPAMEFRQSNERDLREIGLLREGSREVGKSGGASLLGSGSDKAARFRA